MTVAESFEVTIEERLAEVEPMIKRISASVAAKSCIGLEADDIAQDVRIAVLRLAEKYDESRGIPWSRYAGSLIKNRAIDSVRRQSVTRRDGTKKKLTAMSLDAMNDNFDEDKAYDPEDALSDEASDITDWQDLVEEVSKEPQEVRLAVGYAAGLSMGELGLREGLSESRVSQIFQTRRDSIQTNLRRLLGLRRSSRLQLKSKGDETMPQGDFVPATMGQLRGDVDRGPRPPKDPVEQLIGVLENAGEGDVQRIDQRIEELSKNIARLRKFRKVLTAGEEQPQRRPASRGSDGLTELQRKIAEAVRTVPLSVRAVARKINEKDQAVRISAKRSSNFSVDNDMITFKGKLD